MKRIAILLLLMLLLILFGFACGKGTAAGEKLSPDAASFIKWAAGHAIPIKTHEPGNGFEDLYPLRKVIGDAKIVCLGESRHDSHEQFRFKHRMVEFLVEEMGFTVFILEENLPYTRKIDHYILTGEGDPAELLEGMPMRFIWNTREILALVKWMRNYNVNHERKIRFFGMDVTSPLLGMRTVQEYLKKVDPLFAESLRRRLLGLDLVDDNNWSVTLQRYRALSPGEKNTINENYGHLVERFKARRSEYISASSADEYQWALRLAEVGRESSRLYTADSYFEGGLIRDRAMADNVKWIMQHRAPGERVMIWAANAHINRKPVYMPDRFGRAGMVSVGCHLNREMGKDLVTIAAAFNRGENGRSANTGYVDGVLARVGLALFILDLRQVPEKSPAARWLNREWRMQSQDADILCSPAQAYDVVYFIDSISRTTPNS